MVQIVDVNVRYDEAFVLNSQGFKLFTCGWIPAEKEPKALIFLCVPYAMDCSITMNSTAIRLAKAGYGVHGIDYQGHGKSAGPSCYIENFDDLVDDCHQHFKTICEREENKGKRKFLLGESMGGAVALHLHIKNPNFWDGAVLVAPMCRLHDKLKPNPLVSSTLKKLTKYGPRWKIAPTHANTIINIAYKEPRVRNGIKANPYCYKGRASLKTGYEIMRCCAELEEKAPQVCLPFLILHGGEDKVIDISASEHLYSAASSTDKTFRVYPKMWHGLLYGEPLDNVNIVFADIFNWLQDRTSLPNSELEKGDRPS